MDAAMTPEERHLRSMLGEAQVVAVVGISSKPWRASHEVASYLQQHGYRIVPVNPNEDEVLGERVRVTLRSLERRPHGLDHRIEIAGGADERLIAVVTSERYVAPLA